MSIFDITPSYVAKIKKGTSEDPYTQIEEVRQVVGETVPLTQIPSHFEKVVVKDSEDNLLYEVQSTPQTDNTYFVDYEIGYVTFHPNNNNESFTFTYIGVGNTYLNSSRVFTQLDNQNNVTETLGEIIENGRDGIDALNDVVNFQFVGDYNPLNDYSRYNIVSLNGSSFMANVDTSNDPTTSDWDRISIGNEWKGLYSNTSTYYKGQQVVNDSLETIYTSLIDNNINIPLTDANSWEITTDISNVVQTANDKIADLTNLESTVSTNETNRVNAEDTRIFEEDSRQTSETNRGTNESTRITNEDTRITNESARSSSESTRETNEQSRISSENTRETNESNRVTNESSRENAETVRNDAEIVRELQETDRRTNTQTAITNAETATQDTEIAIQGAQDIANNTTFTEEWNIETTYSKNNFVSLNGSSFMSLTNDNLGNEPNPDEDTIYWAIMAKRGEGGVETLIQTYTVIADGENSIPISISFAQDSDRIAVFYEGFRLDKDTHYTISLDSQTINLIDWTMNENDIVKLEVIKNVSDTESIISGSQLEDNSVEKIKLSNALQTELNDKAESTELNAVENRVTTNENDISTNQAEFLSHLDKRKSDDPHGLAFKGATLTKTLNQSVASESLDNVTFQEVDVDIGFFNSENPDRITIPANVKKVKLKASIVCEGDATANYPIGLRFRKNNTFFVNESRIQYVFQTISSSSNRPVISANTGVIDVVEGDYFLTQFIHGKGSTLDIEPVFGITNFSVEVIE